MIARGSRGSSLAVSVLITVLAVAAAVFLVVRLPGRARETADRPRRSRWPPARHRRARPRPRPRAGRRAGTAPRPRMAHRTGTPGSTGRLGRPPRPHRRLPRQPAPRQPAPGQPAPASQHRASTGPATGQAPAGQSAAAQQVLALINQARAQAGLPAVTISPGLDTSASRHTSVMAGGCGLSHQCPGEPPLGTRETAAGVAWTAAGENIGEGGPVAGTAAAIARMAAGLTQSMLGEQPPDDGHRLNILSSAFTHIGIAVFRDSSGTVWMTQDFAN